jgi:hypothetical protein
MTEAEWDACADLGVMLESLRGRGTDRKWWLFVAASCRSEAHFLPAEIRRLVAAVAEGVADWSITPAEWRAALEAVFGFMERLIGVHDFERAAVLRDLRDILFPRSHRWGHQDEAARTRELERGVAGAAGRAARARRWTLFAATSAWAGWDRDYMERPPAGPPPWTAMEHRRFQCRAARDIFGSPFRPPPHLDSSCLAWNDGAVRKMARAVYDACAFDRLPLLADALEDAGCADAADLMERLLTDDDQRVVANAAISLHRITGKKVKQLPEGYKDD